MSERSAKIRKRAEIMGIIGGIQGHLQALDSIYFDSKLDGVSSEIKHQLERIEILKSYIVAEFDIMDAQELLNYFKKVDE